MIQKNIFFKNIINFPPTKSRRKGGGRGNNLDNNILILKYIFEPFIYILIYYNINKINFVK